MSEVNGLRAFILDIGFLDIDDHMRRERARSAELRHSSWWKNRIARASCHYCATPLNAKTATMDHVVPLSQGGSTTKGNVVPACRPCNQRKYQDIPALKKLHSERLA